MSPGAHDERYWEQLRKEFHSGSRWNEGAYSEARIERSHKAIEAFRSAIQRTDDILHKRRMGLQPSTKK